MKGQCTCNLWQFLLGLVLLAGGFYSLVNGYYLHTTVEWYNAVGWYFLGVLFFAFGHYFKHSSCGSCKMHKK